MNNQINNNETKNNEKVVFPHSEESSHMVLDIIEGWNVIRCRLCEKDKKREKFAEHFVKHFIEQKEVPMTIQEIMNLCVPQMEK